jgi:hypothetical protein
VIIGLSGISKDDAKAKTRKEGVQPLTEENVDEFHEEEESWNDPKDFGTTTSLYRRGLVFEDDSIWHVCHLPECVPCFGTYLR